VKYYIIGAGGTGGAIGYYMTKAGKDVCLLARGEHLKAMRRNGLTIRHLWDGAEETVPVAAAEMDEVSERPDVIFVCVKGYSVDSVLPFIRRVADAQTVIIPILNIFGTGKSMQAQLPGLYVLDGCIYVSASREAPGRLVQHGPILRVVYGPRRGQEDRSGVLDAIAKDLQESGITPVYSHAIERDALEKFSYVSPIGAAGLYCHAVARDFQKEGPERELFADLIREVSALADAMGCPFEQDYVKVNMQILANLSPDADTSMQRDVAGGHASEVDGLVYSVVRLGDELGVPVPKYKMVAEELKIRGLK